MRISLLSRRELTVLTLREQPGLAVSRTEMSSLASVPTPKANMHIPARDSSSEPKRSAVEFNFGLTSEHLLT